MSYTERALDFPCGEETLVGVLTAPASPRETAVVIIVGGPQYRAGSHRQFVLLARYLARAGYATLRFDYRGMGDSTGEQLSFEHTGDDIDSAVKALFRQMPEIRRVVLWGLCDGASAALLHCADRSDPRIAGLCLANPWVRSDASLARTHVKHYYAQRLVQREFWLKLLSGKVGATAIRGLTRDVALARLTPEASGRYQGRMASALRGFGGQVLLLLSANDYTAKEFLEHVNASPAWTGMLANARVKRQDVFEADHTFSGAKAHAEMQSFTLQWLEHALREHVESDRSLRLAEQER